jgi:anti-anti-sigma factor
MAGTSRDLSEVRLARSAADRSVLVTLVGEFDLASRSSLDDLVEEILDDPVADVAVDLGPVTFLGSTGLDFLVRLHVRATGAGHKFTVLNPPLIAQHALRSTGLDEVLTIVGSAQPET